MNKTKLQTKRIKDAGGFPKVVLIDTTSFCDLRCSMCSHKNMTRKKGNMSEELFKKIIDEIAENNKNTRVWMVFFGEALILKKKNLFPMIAYAKEKGLKDVVLNSNANLLDKEAAFGLIKSGLDSIYIGIDAFNESTYNKIRTGGNYKKVVKNVTGLIKLKEKLKSKTPKVFVQFVEMDENKDQIKDFIVFWKSKGAIVKIRPKVSWAGLIEAPNLKLSQKERYPCHWAMQTISIASDGRAVLCAVDVDARFVAGDINKESIKKIWNGKLRKIRKMHEDKKFDKLPYPCKECGDWQAVKAEYHSA